MNHIPQHLEHNSQARVGCDCLADGREDASTLPAAAQTGDATMGCGQASVPPAARPSAPRDCTCAIAAAHNDKIETLVGYLAGLQVFSLFTYLALKPAEPWTGWDYVLSGLWLWLFVGSLLVAGKKTQMDCASKKKPAD